MQSEQFLHYHTLRAASTSVEKGVCFYTGNKNFPFDQILWMLRFKIIIQVTTKWSPNVIGLAFIHTSKHLFVALTQACLSALPWTDPVQFWGFYCCQETFDSDRQKYDSCIHYWADKTEFVYGSDH